MNLTRLALLSFALLPALAVESPSRGAPFVASFIYACESEEPRPRLETRYLAAGRPTPRPADTYVEVFERGQAPARAHEVIGSVRVVASSSRTGTSALNDWAKREARRLGGDALVDLACEDAAHTDPPAGPVGLLALDAKVVRWR